MPKKEKKLSTPKSSKNQEVKQAPKDINKKKEPQKKAPLKKITIKTNYLLTLAAVFLISLFLITYQTLNKPHSQVQPSKKIKEIECLKKGNLCTKAEIAKGIKINYQVNKKENYDFYLISNTQEEATYIMAQNIMKDLNWADERTNLKGPTHVMYMVNEKTKNWELVEKIKDYTYEDYGYKYNQEICEKKTKQEKDYNCNINAGYKKLEIKSGKGTIYYNLTESSTTTTWDIGNIDIRARLITREELSELSTAKKGLPEWLVENVKNQNAYWTLSSNTYACNQYAIAAYIVKNIKDEAKIDIANTIYGIKKQEIGLRPVITIKKQ